MSKIIDLVSRRSGKDRPLRIALGKTVRTHKVKNKTIKWAELLAMFNSPKVTSETMAEYLAMPRAEQDAIKDVGYFVPAHYAGEIRKKCNLGPKDLGTLDFDHAKPDFLAKMKALYEGCEFVLYTTHRHTPEQPRFRLVFLFNRGVSDSEYEAVMRMLASRGDINECDDTTFQPSRVMHFASHASDGVFEFYHGEGHALDIDATLQMYYEWNDIAEWPVSERVKNPLRRAGVKAQDPREKRGIIGAFCNCYDIREAMDRFLTGVYVPGSSPNRYTIVGGTTSNGAIIYDGGLHLFSQHESDPCHDKNVNAFDMCRLHLFRDLDERQAEDTDPTRLRSYRAMIDRAKEDPAVRAYLAAERMQLVEDFDDFDDPAMLEADAAPIEPDSATIAPDSETIAPDAETKPANAATPVPARLSAAASIVQWKLQTNDQMGISKERLWNIESIMQNDPALVGCVAWNSFTGTLMQLRRIPGLKQRLPAGGTEWSDLAEYSLQTYFNKYYDVAFPSKLIGQACARVGALREFDPVRDWLDALEWDQVARLDTFLSDHFGAEQNPYHAAVFRKWLTAGVARQYDPGHKFDFILVLEGVEGLSKSRFFAALANGWFSDDFTFGLSSKEIVEKTQGALIIEIAELVARSNTEVEHIKAMLARSTETVRLSYAHYSRRFARRFILAGTTNDATYLRSESGNRRFWCVRGDGREIDVEALRAAIPQLWAEAKDRHTYGEPLWLEDASVAAFARDVQAARVEVDGWTSTIVHWLAQPIPANHYDHPRSEDRVNDFENTPLVPRDRCCATEIWLECLGEEISRLTQRDTRRITQIINKLPGWKTATGVRFGNEQRYVRGRGYVRD